MLKNIFQTSSIPAFIIVLFFSVGSAFLVYSGSVLSSTDMPYAQTLQATDVGQNSAVLNGIVNPHGDATSYHFEYGTTPSMGIVSPTSWLNGDYSDVTVFKAISGLNPGTTYYYRVYSSNTIGWYSGATLNFTTASITTPTPTPNPTPQPQPTYTPIPTPQGSAPYAQTTSVMNVSQTSAIFNGFVSPNGAITSYHFEYGTTPALGSSLMWQWVGSTTNSITVSRTIFDLNPGTLYYFRLVAQNNHGVSNGDILAFRTSDIITPTPTPTPTFIPTPTPIGNAPTVQTFSVASVDQTSAVLNGFVNSNGSTTAFWFEYGTNFNSLNLTTGSDNLSSGNSSNVSRFINNLSPNTTYYFRVAAQNNYGLARGQIFSFTTANNQIDVGQSPAVATRTANVISANSALVYGDITPNGNATTAWFEYGTTPSLGLRTSFQNMGSNGAVTLSSVVTNLSPNTVYYYRAAAQNAYGINYGTILNFRTNPIVAIEVPQPTPVVTTIIQRIIQQVPAPTTVPVVITQQVSRTSTGDDISCFILVPLLSPASPYPGQEFTFTITYKNTCETDFSDVTLKVVLPAQAELRTTNLPYTFDNGNTLTYNIGPIYRNVESTIIIQGVIKSSAKPGDTLIFSGLVNFNDNDGRYRSAVAYLSDSIGQKTAGNLLASIFGALGGWGLWLLLLLFLLLLIAFSIYYMASSKKHKDTEYNKMLEDKMNTLSSVK